ncbi:unnamed protein product [Scytosiphon promiscuus]
MARATNIAVLCCALVSCQAFHTPVATTSTWASARRRHATAQQQCHGSRRPRSALSMKEEATAEKEEKVATPKAAGSVVVERESTAAAGATEAGERTKRSNRQDLYKNQPKPQPKKPWTPKEQEYLDKMAAAPIIYKRVSEQEFYPSVGYESSYSPLGESQEPETYNGDSIVASEGSKEEILMRVVVVGGGEEEGKFLKSLSEKGAGKLVDGLYALWDPREGELSETIQEVDMINVHELGTPKTKNAKEVAKHAAFMAANMLVAVSKHPSYGDDYVPQLRKAALDSGLTFVGPELAGEVADGNMEAFTKLVQATREALEEDEEE